MTSFEGITSPEERAAMAMMLADYRLGRLAEMQLEVEGLKERCFRARHAMIEAAYVLEARGDVGQAEVLRRHADAIKS